MIVCPLSILSPVWCLWSRCSYSDNSAFQIISWAKNTMTHEFLSGQCMDFSWSKCYSKLHGFQGLVFRVHLYFKNIFLWSLFPCESRVLWLDYTLVSTEVHSVCWPWKWKACVSVCLLPWVTVCSRGHAVYVGEAMEHIIISSPSLLRHSLLWILVRCCVWLSSVTRSVGRAGLSEWHGV